MHFSSIRVDIQTTVVCKDFSFLVECRCCPECIKLRVEFCLLVNFFRVGKLVFEWIHKSFELAVRVMQYLVFCMGAYARGALARGGLRIILIVLQLKLFYLYTISLILQRQTAECFQRIWFFIEYWLVFFGSSKTGVSKLRPAGRMRPSRPSLLACGDFLPTENSRKSTRTLYTSTTFMEVMLNTNWINDIK